MQLSQFLISIKAWHKRAPRKILDRKPKASDSSPMTSCFLAESWGYCHKRCGFFQLAAQHQPAQDRQEEEVGGKWIQARFYSEYRSNTCNHARLAEWARSG